MAVFEIVYRCDDGGGPMRPPPADAAAARARLDEGNRTFASLLDPSSAASRGAASCVVPIDLSHIRGTAGAAKQEPFAAVLGCADARVPIELIFNVGPNDLFVVRVAGNSLGPDVLGSLKYAISHLGKSLKIVTVLGHSGCGAVSAAVDVFLNPADYVALATNRAIRSILDQLATVVHASARRLQQTFGEQVTTRPGYRSALIEASVVTNTAFTAYTIQQAIHEEGPPGLQSTYGVYLLDSCRIWSPRIGSDEWSGLAEPPADAQSFAKLGDAIARSGRIIGILNAER
jgi:carbonic anhydrase